MSKYPAVDAAFFEWGTKVGMTEAEIAEDWKSYCDGLERFHEETIAVMGEAINHAPSFCVGGLG